MKIIDKSRRGVLKDLKASFVGLLQLELLMIGEGLYAGLMSQRLCR